MKQPKQKSQNEKLEQSINDLEHALSFEKKAKQDAFYFAGIAKSFETCLEYTWKFFKRNAVDEGLEVFSPKEAIKQAGHLGLIDNVEKWLDYLSDRNTAVHDYLGLSDEEYLKTIKDFYIAVKKIKL